MSDFDRIIEISKIDNLSLRGLAKHLGLKTPQRFYDIKAGKHGISKDLAEIIQSKYFNISLVWLLSGEGNMYISEEKKETASGRIENPDIHQLIVNNTTLTETIQKLSDTNSKLAERILDLTENKKMNVPKDDHAGCAAASGFSEQ